MFRRHPNISHQSGAIRMSILNNDWSPTMGIKAIVIALQALLSDPDLSDPLDEYVMSHYRASRESFNSNARYYTEKYAKERNPPPQLTTRTSGTRRVTRIPKRLDGFLL
ncbi:putative ubiquitin-conjugating enzyme E2, ubiquitin-conjugating enzyme/RWD [Helianthus annuus]|nr:putative ubiquitin-conjugating enzyme E2, ubiquitin-conjugating enzyme/RWD [Helianthus annuus]